MKIENLKVGGMDGYIQAAAADRHALVDIGGQPWERFTVKSGDRWQPGGDTSDDKKASERTEFRSLTEDVVGGPSAFHRYFFDVLIPVNYPHFTPKQTLAQWHTGDYPTAFLRLENRRLEFVLNYQSRLNVRRVIPFTPGKPVSISASFDWQPGPGKGSLLVAADGMPIYSDNRADLVEPGVRTLYLKYGIYRSGMNEYAGPGTPPDQTVYHSGIRRVAPGQRTNSPIVEVTPAPIAAPAIPAPTPTDNAPAALELYGRIGRMQSDLDQLGRDVAAAYQVSDWTWQAAEKLGRLGEQMRRADGKKGKAA